MKNKVKKIFNSKDEFDIYKSNNKIYVINNINYSLVNTDSIYSEIQEYSIYKYTKCYYDDTGPSQDSNWNTVNDPN